MKAKKVISLLMICTMILSLFGSISAFADEETGEQTNIGKVYYYDGFEDGIIATRESGTNGGAHYVSGITGNGLFVEKPKDYDAYSNHVTMEVNAGYKGEGDTALYVHTDTTTTGASSDGSTNYRGTMPLGTKNLTVSASKGYLIQYKVKFDDFGTGVATTAAGSGIQAAMSLCSVTEANASYMVYRHSGWSDNIPGAKAVFSEDVWYDVIWYTSYNGTTMVPHTRVINSETGEIVHSLDNFDNYDAAKTKVFSEGTEYIFKPITLSHGSGENYCNEFKAYIDDFSLIEYSTDDTPELYAKRTNIVDDEENIDLSPEFTLSFDMPVDASNATFSLYETEAPENTVAVTADTYGCSTIVVNLNSLEMNTGYTLKYTGIKSVYGVSAPENTISFNTLNKYKMTSYDGFEDGSVSNYYYKSGDSGSGLFVTPGGSPDVYNEHATLKENAGYNGDGDSALYIHCDTTLRGNEEKGYNYRGSTPLQTKQLTVNNDRSVLIQYKLKIEDFGTSEVNNIYALMIGNVGAPDGSVRTRVSSIAGTTAAAKSIFAEDKWYDIIWYATYNGTRIVPVMTINDADTGEQVWSKTDFVDPAFSSGYAGGENFTFRPIWLDSSTGTNYCDGFKAYIDDFSLIEYTTNSTPELFAKRTNIEDDATDVSLNPVFVLTFDMKLAASGNSITLYEEENPTSFIDVDVSELYYNKLIVKASSLKENTSYILDFSEVKSEAGTLAGETGKIKFTTLMDSVRAVASDIAISGGVITAGEKTVTITNSGDALENLVLVVAMYSNDRLESLVDVVISEEVTLNKGENTLPLDFETSVSGVGCVKIMLLDSWSSLTPLMDAYAIGTSE